tara:strand:+ start:565 stop:777 length:213 start_codon:yes stop_codon:yes gene_type:complete
MELVELDQVLLRFPYQPCVAVAGSEPFVPASEKAAVGAAATERLLEIDQLTHQTTNLVSSIEEVSQAVLY